MRRKLKDQPTQLTVRGVSSQVKKQLMSRASREGKSLNTVLVEVISNAVGTEPMGMEYRNLSKFAGIWVEDTEFDAAIDAQDQVDTSLWQ